MKKFKGRNSIERMINGWERNGSIIFAIQKLLIFSIIVLNSNLRNEPKNGLFFFLIFAIISASDFKKTTDFFGTSSTAILIIAHISIFGENPLALILTFFLFLSFAEKLSGRPSLIFLSYLVIDTIFISSYANPLNKSLIFWGEKFINSSWVYGISIGIIGTYLFIIAERYFNKIFHNKLLKKYGIFLILFILIELILFIGIYIPVIKILTVPLLMIFLLGMIIFKEGWSIFILGILMTIIIISMHAFC